MLRNVLRGIVLLSLLGIACAHGTEGQAGRERKGRGTDVGRGREGGESACMCATTQPLSVALEGTVDYST